MGDFYLSRTPSSGGNQRTFTVSTWCKLDFTNNEEHFFGAGTASSAGEISMCVDGGEKLMVMFNVGGTEYYFQSAQVLRDYSSWYHIVVAVDTTQASATDRMKMYVNGSEVTVFSSDNRSSLTQNTDFSVNSTSAITYVGRRTSSTGNGYYKGYLTQTILIDGLALTPTSFASTNANNIWVPNTSPSVTYGTNGFKLEYKGTGTSADASGFGADTSGNNNHLAVSGSLGTNPSTTDTPQNNFCTLNMVANSSMTTVTEGNLTATGNTNSNNGNTDGTIAPSGGKWYWEGKFVTAATANTSYPNMGVYPVKVSRQPKDGGGNAESGWFSDGCSFMPNGSKFRNNSTSGYGSAWSTNDIIGVALDMENYAVYFSINGTWQDSGDPTSGASKTGAAQAWTAAEGAYVPQVSSFNNSVMELNFGNPGYTIASSNADANGEGSFEYAPPSGYYALCTNNLALYGG
jgi:hypothetical protein